MVYGLLAFLLLSVSSAVAQQPAVPAVPSAPAATQAEAKPTYEALLERVRKHDQTVDFQALRLAYTETKAYGPYGGDAASQKNLFASLKANEYDKALESATTILAGNYLDIIGHFGSFVAHRELGHAELAAYHRFVYEGLLNSIKNSGDGKSMETAFVVISTDEEYALFNYLGLRPTGQALVKEKGHNFDKMTALDPKTNQSVVYYFNIDKPFNWLDKSLKK
jgi:uncharacterized protein HemY